MSVTPDEHKRARFQGEAFAEAALASLPKQGLPIDLAESFAAGIAIGVRRFVTAYVSERAAYELLQAAADRIDPARVAPARAEG